nr:hypothetical protein [Tanacetum cinerariifolium]
MTPETSLTHVPQAYAKFISSDPSSQYFNEPLRKNSFTFKKHANSGLQNQTFEPIFEARVQGYMAAHTEMIEKFEEAFFKQREEINGLMAKMFGLLKELTASRTSKKVLVREEARHPVTKNVNAISLVKMEKEKNTENKKVVEKNVIELSEFNTI